MMLVTQPELPPRRYIQAATSPKDIIIMVDISGSMKGLKMTIAKHTINTILDTLGENDFVNVVAVRQTRAHMHMFSMVQRDPPPVIRLHSDTVPILCVCVCSTPTTCATLSRASEERWSRLTWTTER